MKKYSAKEIIKIRESLSYMSRENFTTAMNLIGIIDDYTSFNPFSVGTSSGSKMKYIVGLLEDLKLKLENALEKHPNLVGSKGYKKVESELEEVNKAISILNEATVNEVNRVCLHFDYCKIKNKDGKCRKNCRHYHV